MIIACATDDKVNLTQEHFGDADYYNVYELNNDGIQFLRTIENTVISNIHPDPGKAKKILGLLDNVDILINKAFGTNITVMTKYIVPAVIRVDSIQEALELLQMNLVEVEELLQKNNEFYFTINDKNEVKYVEQNRNNMNKSFSSAIRGAKIVVEKCVGCGRCINSCPFGAISMENGKAIIDESLCRGCMKCVRSCPKNAIVRA